MKRKQTSIEAFGVKAARPSSDEPKKKEEKRPVGRPREYANCELNINELHDFNNLLEVDQCNNEKYIKFYEERVVPTTTRKS